MAGCFRRSWLALAVLGVVTCGRVTVIATAPPSAPGAWPGGFMAPGDALGVHVNQVRRQIRSFDDARHADIANERLPQFTPPAVPLVPAPSMRLPRLAEDGDAEGAGMEGLIRRALEEEGLGDGGMAERLADRIARGKRSARPRGLKRYETAP